MREYMVDYEFEETPHGRIPNMIRIFSTRKEAEEFASTAADGVVNEVIWEVR